MAVKDVKAKDMVVHYTGGYMRGARGLLEAAVVTTGGSAGVNVKTGASGRHYLTNTTKRRPGKGGRTAYLNFKDGGSYEIRYGGTFHALVTAIAAKNLGNVIEVITESGTRAGFRL